MKKYVVLLFGIKFLLLVFFSSDYKNKLFVPFVSHFLTNFGNPWEYFYLNPQGVEFPYPPLMLYLLSLFYLPVHLFGGSIIVQNLFFKLPVLLADAGIAYMLYRMFPDKVKETVLFYFSSLIILYSCYIHSQLDLIPTFLLFVSVFYLTKGRLLWSAVFFGLSVSTKFHVAAALPLMCIYIFKNFRKRDVLYFLAVPAAVYLFFAFPYLGKGYYSLVLANPKQMMIFDVFYRIGDLKIYLPIFGPLIIYLRFLAYRKINNDLLYAFLGILFSVFVMVIVPAPAWYVWILPFVSIAFIKYCRANREVLFAYWGLNVIYLVYFVFFHRPEFGDMVFLSSHLNFKVMDDKLRNLVFNCLEVALFTTVYLIYRLGVKSNSVYRKDFATVIGIGGDSGSGKSTVLSDIKQMLGSRVLEMEGDADHKWERGNKNWRLFTHLHPKANYLYKQAEDIDALKKGNDVWRADYDHTRGVFTDPQKLIPNDFVIFSGLHTFYLPKMRKLIDLKIYLDTEEQLKRHWKIIRDNQQRGYGKERVIQQIEERLDDAEKFIYPQKNYADLAVNYFTQGDFPAGDEKAQVPLKLKLTMDANIHIETLINQLAEETEIEWDYSDDLKTQYVIFSCPVRRAVLERIARDFIVNREEILGQNPVFQGGYRGIVQLIVLLVLSEKMKE